MSNDKKLAIVTGGASGIGLGISTTLVNEKYQVLVVDRAKNVEEISASLGPNCKGFLCDLESPQEIKRLYAHVEQTYGRCDVLVNNAGVHPKVGGEKMLLNSIDLDNW